MPSVPQSTFHPGLEVFGVRLIGMTSENGRKLAVSLALAVLAPLAGWLISKLIARLTERSRSKRVAFWVRQGVSLFVALVVILGLMSIWFDDPARLTTAMGLVTAGIAVAMQRVITAIAGYFLILRGSVFNVGDRIVIGGVRGDVSALGFLQTTIMEMGETPNERADAPATWVHSRQYTGRLVTVSNAAIFDQPVYNFTRDFPYLFEELAVPIRYGDDRKRAERILLQAAERHTVAIRDLERNAVEELRRRYFMEQDNPGPRTYWKLTDNWLEIAVRFVVRDHGIRAVKDAITRDVLDGFDAAGIGIASDTYAVVEMPELKVRVDSPTPHPRG